MKLMISYARRVEEKAIVDFVKRLRDKPLFDVFVDRDKIPCGVNWWHTICHAIEESDCVIVILSERYNDSPYCSEELEYAIQLNKAILPLRINECDIPEVLQKRHIQVLSTTVHTYFDQTTFENCLISLGVISRDIAVGKYPRPLPQPERPIVPIPNDPFERYSAATAALNREDNEEAVRLFQQVVSLDNEGILGGTAREYIPQIKRATERNRHYQLLVESLKCAKLELAVQMSYTMRDRFVQEYGKSYDPQNILSHRRPRKVLRLIQASQWYIFGVIANIPKEKIDSFSQAIALDANFVPAYIDRGSAFFEQGELEKATADWTEAIRLLPDHPISYNNRGVVLTKQAKLDEALPDFDQAIILDPNYSLAYVNRGQTFATMGDTDAAIADFDRAILLDPNSFLAFVNRSIVYADLMNLDQALQDIYEAIRINPKSHIGHSHLAWIYGLQRDFSKALENFENALQLAPRNAHAHSNKAYILCKVREFSKAVTVCNKAIEINPNLRIAYSNRSYARASLGNISASQRDSAKAFELAAQDKLRDKDKAFMFENRAAVSVLGGNFAGAIADFEQALNLYPPLKNIIEPQLAAAKDALALQKSDYK